MHRTFKTARFSKDARKARISDSKLCEAGDQVMAGQADDLGGEVFKKRLNGNMHRAIVLAKAGRCLVYEYLYAKKDRDNIDDDELAAFRVLAKAYGGLNERQVAELISSKHLVEICRGDET